MHAAAGRFVRLLVRVPEAYWLVRAYGVKRPGVLVLDGTGRKVGAFALNPAAAAAESGAGLAAELDRCVSAAPAADGAPPQLSTTWRVAAHSADNACRRLVEIARRLPGVTAARCEHGGLTVRAARLWFDPSVVTTAARLLRVGLEPSPHRLAVIPVTEVDNTPHTLRDVMRLERTHAGILVAVPDEARNEIRVLYDSRVISLDAVRHQVTAVGYRLRPARGR